LTAGCQLRPAKRKHAGKSRASVWQESLFPYAQQNLKFSHKLKKLREPLTYRRMWRRIERLLHPVPMGPLLEKIDLNRLREIQARYASSSEHYAKYLDLERYLKLNIERVQQLKLHRSSPQEILDLGCGGGFFLFILQHYGHRCLGLDIDEFPLFTDLTQLLGVPRKVWTIKAFEPLPDLGRKFDWITAFSTAFHGKGEQSWQWSVEEWKFFLDDLDRRLKPGGRIFFGLNPSYAGEYYTPEIATLFQSRGAEIERAFVFFPPGN
jgi:SAM-dependent methyltransferase